MIEIDTFEPGNSILTRLEIDTKLRSKFLAVTLHKEKYCFRIVAVKEIIEGIEDFVQEDDIHNENIFCLLEYKGVIIPVFDFRGLDESLYQDLTCKCYTLICDVIGDGLLFKIGILVTDIKVVFNALINEINEDIIYERV
jgi:chemotaxis signal transduction protein